MSCVRLVVSCARHNLYIHVSLPLTTEMERDSIFFVCFKLGFKQREIVAILQSQFGLNISEHHLRWILCKLNLHRDENSDIVNVATFVSSQLEKSGQLACRGQKYATIIKKKHTHSKRRLFYIFGSTTIRYDIIFLMSEFPYLFSNLVLHSHRNYSGRQWKK